MRHLDLFSGIGGFALAASSVWGDDYQNAGFCDNEPFAQAVLKKHWPNSHIYGDIKELSGGGIGPVDLVTGGFPCQPFSAAGKRRGKEDDRHLWPEMLRVIRETAPRWVIGENVGGLLTWNGGMVLDEVFADLEAEGYEVWAVVVPACAVGAPHRRDRVWIVAHSKSDRDRGTTGAVRQEDEQQPEKSREEKRVCQSIESDPLRVPTDSKSVGGRRRTGKKCGVQERLVVQSKPEGSEVRGEGEVCTGHAPNAEFKRLQGSRSQRERLNGLTDREGSGKRRSWAENWPEVAAELCTVDDGLPDGSPRPKGWRNAALKGAGNAIVPQVAMMIMREIQKLNSPA